MYSMRHKRARRAADPWHAWVVLPVLLMMATFAGPAALATPNHAHHHYHMGVRAYAGTRHAAMLHHEASAPGLDLTLARENALEMETLAAELNDRAARLSLIVSDRERAAIGDEIVRMTELSMGARHRAAELGVWIDEALVAGAPADGALAERVTLRCRELFHDFRNILISHKQAENALGIPVPEDPPKPR